MKRLVVLMVLAAVLVASCSVIPNAPASAHDCGTVSMRGPNPPAEAAARQAEECFWHAAIHPILHLRRA
jgi:hypothetical protein